MMYINLIEALSSCILLLSLHSTLCSAKSIFESVGSLCLSLSQAQEDGVQSNSAQRWKSNGVNHQSVRRGGL